MSSKTTIDNDILGECSLVLSDPFKCGYFLSLSFLLLGIVFLSVGMLRPRPYVFDPNMAARDMEAIEMHYVQLSRRFDLVTVAGMVSVTAGGIVFTINLVIALWNLDTYPSVLDQHRRRPDESVRLRPVPGTDGNSYGSSQCGLDG